MPAKIESPGYRDIYRLHIWRRSQYYLDVALDDGTWTSVDVNAAPPDNSGLVIPGDLFDDVFKAFLEFKGYKSHEPTEVKVLREWLALETKRVENLIADVSRKALL